MSYLVFARKYRPQSFEDVLGQEHVATTLKNAMAAGRLAHAYLFCGPRGVGKTTMARILAKAVNCMRSPGPAPCGACEACVAIAAGGDIDVMELDAASNRKIENIEPLVDSARYLPQRSPKKIYIVDEAHMLSSTAWNALLKTLEEPPPHVMFVFATTDPQKVIETVRSRCQRFDFRRITPADIERKLRRIAAEEGARVEDEVFGEIASRATGGLRDAETLLDQMLSSAPQERPLAVADLMAIVGGIPRAARARILDAARAGSLGDVLGGAGALVDAGADPQELLKDLYGDLHARAVAAALAGEDGVEWCLAAAEIVARHQALARDSRAARATLDLALLSLAKLGDVEDLERLVARVEGLPVGPPAVVAPAQAPAPAAAPPPKPAPAKLALPPPGPPRLRAPPGGTPPVSGAPSSAEIARIRAHPRVKEVLSTFEGEIEHVRRSDEHGQELR